MNNKFATRMQYVKSSAIRELLKLTEQPDIISFAGGLPAPELFPIEQVKATCQEVLTNDGFLALQYSTTEGYEPLRKEILNRMKIMGINATVNNVLITSGSQQGLDFSGKIFIDADDIVVCERPSYLGAINAFKAYQPKFIDIPMDENGMIIDELEVVLQHNKKVKFIYTIPDFQNPTGLSMSLERRKKIIELANKYDVYIVEDNPYGELRFEGEIIPAIKSFDTEGRVIYLGTFSKIFCPGMRLGWIYANHDILQKFIIIKQGADLQSSTIAQRETYTFMHKYDINNHISKIKNVYKNRRNLMLETIAKEFPKNIKITYPKGGLFTWVELPKNCDAGKLLQKALEEKVAFVPGGPFFSNGGGDNHFRMNYSNMNEEKIIEGVNRLGKVLEKFLSKQLL